MAISHVATTITKSTDIQSTKLSGDTQGLAKLPRPNSSKLFKQKFIQAGVPLSNQRYDRTIDHTITIQTFKEG